MCINLNLKINYYVGLMEDTTSLDHSGDLSLDNIKTYFGHSHVNLAKNIANILGKPL